MNDLIALYILIGLCVFFRDIHRFHKVRKKYGAQGSRHFFINAILPSAACMGVFWPIALGYFLVTGREL